ncbi:hypothetical protein I7I51_02895 [Histoplasma capsulatum]|uniref:Uncharacterized protein n=1 Tax=Ajellomyces capsulatus TaxID=5037 RepID=A0A8A1MJM9_AJECA|nr:hypothetical protein I7I51_02895 [Histoplasma capsulatum]
MLQGSKLETTLEPETNQLVRCGCTGIMELWPAKLKRERGVGHYGEERDKLELGGRASCPYVVYGGRQKRHSIENPEYRQRQTALACCQPLTWCWSSRRDGTTRPKHEPESEAWSRCCLSSTYPWHERIRPTRQLAITGLSSRDLSRFYQKRASICPSSAGAEPAAAWGQQPSPISAVTAVAQLHDRKCDHWLRGRFAGVYIQSLRRIAIPPPSTLGEARACTTAPRTGQIYAPTPSCIKQASYQLHARPPSIVQREESGTQGRSTLFGFGWKVIFLFHS